MSDLFAGRYDIKDKLGQGAFGVVHLAHDVRLRGRPVALKVLHPALSTDPSVVRLFENEAGVLAALRHDHIITVYDVGVWELRRYIVMDYVAGPSLAQVIKEQGAQPPERVRDWLRQAAEALAYAHGQGVLHRDVKSANLLLETARDRLFVSDFGLARAAQVSGGSSVQSEAHLLTGTAAYRAPEVHRTGHSVASDLYSLGVVAYELLSGQRPFDAVDPLDLMMAHATEPVPPLPASTPAPLAALVSSLLAKDPAQRPAGAAVVVERLGNSQDAAPPPVVPPPVDTPPVKPPPSVPPLPDKRPPRRWLGWLAGGVALLAVVLLIGLAVRPRTTSLEPTPIPPIATPVPPTVTPTLTPVPPTVTPTIISTATNTPTITPTAIDTATATPIPTPVPTPALPLSTAKRIWYDDFSSSSSGWDVFSTSEGSVGYEDGKYLIETKTFLFFTGIWGEAGSQDNVILQVKALGPISMWTDGAAAVQGIVFDWKKDWVGTHGDFFIAADGRCGFSFGEGKTTFVVAEGYYPYWGDAQRYYVLTVWLHGNEAIGFVDDTYCTTVFLPDRVPGMVGLAMSPNRDTGNAKAFFDDFAIYKPAP